MVRPDTLNQHGDAAKLQGRNDFHEGVGAGGVEHPQLGKPDDGHLDVLHLADLLEDPFRGAEEHGTVQPEGGYVLITFPPWSGNLLTLHTAQRGELPQREKRRCGQADLDRNDQVEGHSDECCEDKDRRVRPR
jgi:hypothetical protein